MQPLPEEIAPPLLSEEGLRLVKQFLKGEGGTTNELLPTDEYVASATVRRSQEDELVAMLADRLPSVMPLKLLCAHAVLHGGGTTTILRRVAMLLKSSSSVRVTAVVHNSNECRKTCEIIRNLPRHATEVVVMTVSQSSSKNPLVEKLAKIIYEVQKRRVGVKAVILTVEMHDLGDIPPHHEFILDPLLSSKEVKGFVSLYSRFFPQYAKCLQELEGSNRIFISLPCLTVSGGKVTGFRNAIESLILQMDPTRRYLARYLALLATLELFASGRDGMPGYLQGPSLGKEWA